MTRGLLGTAAAVIALASPAAGESPPQPVTGADFSGVRSFAAAWSPDGTRLALVRTISPPNARPIQIVVMNVDRSHAHSIGNGSRFSWSPDGRRIVFFEDNASSVYLAVAQADGSGSRRLVRVQGNSLDRPAWSPDGRLIAFGTGSDISVVRPDGTGLRRLIRNASEPDWSPDASRLVFVTSGNEDSGHIEIAAADGSGRTRLRAVEPRLAGQPRWSPDGSRIAFISGTGSADNAVYVMKADGTGAVTVTPPTDFRDPSWAPDSSRLAAGRDGEIYLVKLDGSAPVRFTYGGCTLVGTDAADRLVGRSGDDVICGFGGDDAILGGLGDDRIVGGAGDDRIDAGPGRDVLFGEDGADMLDGGTGRDSISGGDGHDTIRTHDGQPDFADGGAGVDTSTSDARDCLILVERGGGGVRGCTGTPTFAVAADPAWSPDGSKLAFVDRRGLLGTLYVMNADGSGKRRVIPGWFDAAWPSWSPDGRRIAFQHARGAGRAGGIYVVGVDGRGLRFVVTGRQPAWSPGGKLIAFVATGRLGNDMISVVSPESKGVREIANSRDECEGYIEPAWSPDGEVVAFAATGEGGQCGFRVYIGSTRGSGGVGRVLAAGGWWEAPDWSPDGKLIALVDYSHNGRYKVGVFDRRTRRVRYLRDGWRPRWSPDGRRLAVVRGIAFDPKAPSRICVMNADGTDLRLLTP
ncbi:MAG: LpqB family beta-propeller domain-containing protein [Gaiellaceae bacterium]